MLKKYKDFINESSSDFEKEFQKLIDNNKKSTYVNIWISKLKSLINGEVSMLSRSDFKKPMGEQVGLEFIDSLVSKGFLNVKKERNKVFIYIDNIFKDLKNEIELLKNIIPGTIDYDDYKNILTIEILVTDQNSNSNLVYKDIENFAKEADKTLSKYFDTKINIETEDFSDMSKKNRYISKDFIANYKIVISKEK